jgi:opacity protein-like surface antigen
MVLQKEIKMRKFAIASILALAAASASALELGVVATRGDTTGDTRNYAGVTLGQSFGKLNATAGFERSTVGGNQNRWSLIGGYDIAKMGVFTITPKVGYAYLDNQAPGVDNGSAATVGLGVSVPVAKKVTVGLDYAYQKGQDRVSQFDGNRVSVSAKYAF